MREGQKRSGKFLVVGAGARFHENCDFQFVVEGTLEKINPEEHSQGFTHKMAGKVIESQACHKCDADTYEEGFEGEWFGWIDFQYYNHPNLQM